jgi:acyl-CoA thioester hydrolase
MGVVYYGNYLTFFEVGRAELMRELGFPYSRMEALGYSLVVVEAAARYHGNVGYDSLVTVQTAVTQLKRATIRFDYKVVSQDDGLLVTGHTLHACVRSNQKPIRIPDEIKGVIEKNVRPPRR